MKVMGVRRSVWKGIGFLLPGLLGLMLFYVIPFLISVLYSFSAVSGRFIFRGWDNYRAVLSSGSFRLAARNTLAFLLSGVGLILPLGYLTAALLDSANRHWARLSSSSMTCLLMPMVLPSGALIMFFQVLSEQYGVMNSILDHLGIEPIQWLRSGSAFWILIVIFLWKNLGYIATLLLAGRMSVPTDMLEAAQLDGAGRRILFFQFTLPHMLPFFSISTIMSIMAAFKIYRESFLLMGMYPDRSVYLLQNYLSNHFDSLNYQHLSTATVLFVLLLCPVLGGLMRIGLREQM